MKHASQSDLHREYISDTPFLEVHLFLRAIHLKAEKSDIEKILQ